MAFKQPRIPEYRESEGAGKYLKSLVLFLKDFCMDCWVTVKNLEKKAGNIEVPVSSVNGQTGDVQLKAEDVGAVAEQGWLDRVYPVGSIYMSVNSASPDSLFGGTWERMYSRFLLGADNSSYPLGSTGGSATHTLTANQLPKISGAVSSTMSGSDTGELTGASGAFKLTNQTVAPEHNGKSSNSRYRTLNMSFGGGEAHNNMPPYIAVNIWKRTA